MQILRNESGWKPSELQVATMLPIDPADNGKQVDAKKAENVDIGVLCCDILKLCRNCHIEKVAAHAW